MFKRLKKVVKRSLSYISRGYSLASLPLAFFGYASSIYYLAIDNIPALKAWFPHFSDFIITGILTLPIVCGVLGYVYYKRSALYRAEQEIAAEATPYIYKSLPGLQTTLFRYQALGLLISLKWYKKLNIISVEEEREWNEYTELLRHLSEGGDMRDFKFGEKGEFGENE